MNSKIKSMHQRPWWMVNGVREPWGDLWQDRIDSEWYRWNLLEMKEDDEDQSSAQPFGGEK